MYYQQIFAENNALSAEEASHYDRLLARLSVIQQRLVDYKSSGELPFMSLPEQAAETEMIAELGANIRRQSDGLIVLGTGGSSLGGKTVCALSDGDYPVYFLENLDPHSITQFLSARDLSRMHTLIISKSGGTMDTIAQALMLLEAVGPSVKPRAHVITMPQPSALRALAEHYDIETIPHHPKVGGRFSVLSHVGLLPAAAAGLDIAAIQGGAKAVMDDVLSNPKANALVGAAWQVALMQSRPISILMPYCDRLRLFGNWYRQLWAESLGKAGHGSTPSVALGAVDQHSQLQLYLDGPCDKSFNLITLNHAGKGPLVPSAPMQGWQHIAGKPIGDVMDAMQHGTCETLKRHHLPLRQLALDALSEKTLGALLMHFMLETVVAAELLGVNAFNQPAVEQSKQLARTALGAA